jgi:hypothetical protein
MIAVNDLDIHARVGHSPGYLALLAGNVLPQLLHKDLTNIRNLNTDVLERFACSFAVIEQKMHMPDAVNHPTAAALNTYAGRTERLAHSCHLAGFVF